MNTLPESKLVKSQKKNSDWKMISPTERMKVFIRYDDECNNGHNTFSITAEIQEKRGNYWRDSSGGCLHDEVVKHFPELSKYIKWHLTSSDGPMYYVQNTTYHAGDRDCWGKRKGQIKSWTKVIRFGNSPISHKVGDVFWSWLKDACEDKDFEFILNKIEHPKENKTYGPKYTLNDFSTEWYKSPFDSETEAREFIQALTECEVFFDKIPASYGEGKERDLDAARRCAVWSDATDEELLSEDLRDKLVSRLPKLMEDFKADMEELGFQY